MKAVPLKEFIASGKLRRADVVLGSGRNVSSRLIREATGSKFSHAALVFAVPHIEEGFDRAFAIESNVFGVGIVDLESMAKPGYALAIKRLEKDWFTEDVAKLVRGHMLNYVKAPYDFFTVVKLWKSIITGRPMIPVNGAPSRFLCSGLVQHGFAETVMIKCPENIQDVMFKPEADFYKEGSLLSLTPKDLAATEKLKWKYVIKDGFVTEVDSYESAVAAIEK